MYSLESFYYDSRVFVFKKGLAKKKKYEATGSHEKLYNTLITENKR